MRMKRLPAFTLGILVMIGATEARSSGDDEKAVATLDTEYQAAVKNNDVATMDRILADDFVLGNRTGQDFKQEGPS
jgi:ketosteroid isomerase-like protein